MKKTYLLIFILLVSFSVFSQEIQEESIVINIEVPVRVFKGDSFVADLNIDDFEVLENGIPQKIEAVYLIKKRTVERSEEKKRFMPNTQRNFYLFFDITEYDPRLEQAMRFFIDNVLVPRDNLVIVTPMKTYRMKNNTFELVPKEKVVEQLIAIIRKDVLVGSSEYNTTIRDVAGTARALQTTLFPSAQDEFSEIERGVDDSVGNEFIAMSIEEQIMMYSTLLTKLEALRNVNQKKMLDFADSLKDKQGQKYVFMFYQKEFIPKVSPRILDQAISMFQDTPTVIQDLTMISSFYRRDISFDVDSVKQAYADSSISIHFLFINKPPTNTYGVSFEEHSEDIFAAFYEMANATGGLADTSINPDLLMRKAVYASENYYLLYYSPLEYKTDGKFKEIEVRVKRPGHQVSHRAGYFAN
jgi:VWFA-related protein